MAYRYPWGNVWAMLKRYYTKVNKPLPPTINKALQGIPSFLSLTEMLLNQMKQKRTPNLVIDVRGNPGGATPMVYPFLYQLFGDAYYGHRFPSEFVTVVSEIYLKKYHKDLMQLRQEENQPDLQLGDYHFSEEKQLSAAAKRKKTLDEYQQKGMSFAAKLIAQNGRAIYTPKKIIVLCDANTFSAAFHFMYYLREMGAIVVGVPSSQAPNTSMESTSFTLSESKLEGSISNSMQIFLPDNPREKVLWPDYPLSYQLAKKYNFDEDAILRYALDLLADGKLDKRLPVQPGKPSENR